jgi:hypothetical protein
MSKVWVAAIAGGLGVLTGLFLAKLYAQNKTENTIHDALSSVGLGGGVVENVAKGIIVPQVG